MNNLRNPFYKEYKKNPLVPKPHYTFKLPEEVKADFDEYLKAFPNPNKAMLELVIEILNSKCTERKYYDIDVVCILPLVYDLEKENIGLILAVKDNYYNRTKRFTTNSSSIILNNETYLNPSKEIDLEDFSTMLNNSYFTDSGIEPIDYKYLEESIQEYYLSNDFNFEDYSLVHFKINNFLDEFIENEFQTKNKTHIGLGYFKSNFIDKLSYYIYEWKFDRAFNFEMLNVRLVSEENFNILIANSSNEDLKQSLKDFKDSSPYSTDSSITEEDEVEELKKMNRELIKTISYLEDMNKDLQEENKSLRTSDIEGAALTNKKVEKLEDLYQLVKKIQDKNQQS